MDMHMHTPKLQSGQIVTLKSHTKQFTFSGLNKVIELLGSSSVIKARVIRINSYSPADSCHEIKVEWFTPNSSVICSDLGHYIMLESEFVEFTNTSLTNISDELKSGEWAYYMGGCDTSTWKPGMVGKIREVLYESYTFEDCGDMRLGWGNFKKYFRPATSMEIQTVCGYITRHITFETTFSGIENDETKVSYISKPLVANKINNSKEIENFLLTI